MTAPGHLPPTASDNLQRTLQTLTGEIAPGVDPFDAPCATGHRRAAQAVPLDSVLPGGAAAGFPSVEPAPGDPPGR